MKTFTGFAILFICSSFLSCSSSKSSSGGLANGSIPISTVIMTDTKFVPESITISKGTTVTWRNMEDHTHNATADDKSWKTDDMELGQSKSVTFDKPGTYNYHCTHHTILGIGMTGTVIVN